MSSIEFKLKASDAAGKKAEKKHSTIKKDRENPSRDAFIHSPQHCQLAFLALEHCVDCM